MNAIDILRRAQESGVHISVAGSDLILDADCEPASRLLDAIRHQKDGIVALLRESKSGWSANDWQFFFEERARIAEHKGRVTRAEAKGRAFEWCISEWMEHNPEPSPPDCCAWCDKPDVSGASVVPFGTQEYGHTWLHPECWEDWLRHRRNKAANALIEMNVVRSDP